MSTDYRTALAQPEPQGRPTDEDLYDLADVFNGDPVPAMRRALELWGRPTIGPVPVAERLPGPEDCDAEGRCWWWCHQHESWELDDSQAHYRHWLPHHALPVPGAEVG
jgi:hypothetical protein